MSLPAPEPDTQVVVTGASAGIGTSLARELAARGHGLTLVARRGARLRALAKELREEHGVRVEILTADLATDDGLDAVKQAVTDGSRVTVGLCANAGIGSFGRFHELAAEKEEALVRLNVVAPHALTRAALPGMVDRGEGAVLVTASIMGFHPYPMNASYGASKAFAVSFAEAVHTELQGTGVSVTSLCPGPTRTEIFDRSGAEGVSGAGPSLFWDDPEDVARQAVAAMADGRRSVVPGLTNQLYVQASRVVPRSVTLPFARFVNGRRVADLIGRG